MRHIFPLLLLLSACSGDSDDGGTPTEAPALEIQGATYVLSVVGLSVPSADDGVADLLRLFFTRTVWLGIDDASDSGFTMRAAFSEVGNNVQDPCSITVDFAGIALDGTDFSFGPKTTTFQGEVASYTLEDLALTGRFTDDGREITDVTLSGAFDVRDAERLGFLTADGLCDSLGDLNLPCRACSSDSAIYCIDLEVEGLVATKANGVVLVPVATIDPVECPPAE